MHPIRHLIKIVELQDTSTSGAPPTLVDEPGGRRGPEGGKYWFHGGQKVIVPPSTDFAIQPMEQYRQFGFNPQDMMAWFEQHNKVAADELRRHLENPDAMIFGNLGTRGGCITYALTHGWAYIEYNEQWAVIWLDGKHARDVIHAAGSLFSMMNMEVIKLVLPQGEAFTNRSISFHKEDHPGFAGAYGALMQWVKDGTVPEQEWTYTAVQTGDTLDSQGLHAKPVDYARKGGWTDRKVFAIPYFGRRGVMSYFGQQKGGTIFRFPAKIARDLALERGQFVNDEVLYSKKPFVIPANAMQRKTTKGWESV